MNWTPTELETVAARILKPHSVAVDEKAAEILRAVAADYRTLREKFDEMLIAEVKKYNGIPSMMAEQGALRETIALMLEGGK